jgi:hypothetical protein
LSAAGHAVLSSVGVTVRWFGRSGLPTADGELVDVEGVYERFFDAHEIDAFIIRPDYHVFGACRRGQTSDELLHELSASITAARR